jgi:hypothetical protein
MQRISQGALAGPRTPSLSPLSISASVPLSSPLRRPRTPSGPLLPPISARRGDEPGNLFTDEYEGDDSPSSLAPASSSSRRIPVPPERNPHDIDMELWAVLDMASEDELVEIWSLLNAASPFSPGEEHRSEKGNFSLLLFAWS